MDRNTRAGLCLWLATTILLRLVSVVQQGEASLWIKLPPRSVYSAEAEFCAWSEPLMNPFYETRYGVKVVWQIPPNPKAVLFIAHGRGLEPLSFFDRSSNCTQCYGFPEDRGVVLEALKRKYAVLLVKSVEDVWEPTELLAWPAPLTQDRQNVRIIIKEWTREKRLEHLPLASFGHSAGGFFSSVLTLDVDFKVLVLMCSSIELPVLEHADRALFPHVLHVPMPADVPFYVKIVERMDVLRSKGIYVGEIDAWPRPISPRLFADRIPCLDMNTSANIYAAYKTEGWLDEKDFLIVNPRAKDWRRVLQKWKVLPFCKNSNDLCFAGHVGQELNAAYGEHSLTSWENEPLFNWLDSLLLSTGVSHPPSTLSASS